MFWRIDTTSEQTLADQLAAQVRRAVTTGQVEPGERLPSARELAAMLDINLHTVLRAYQALRDEGVLELRRGRGATIAANAAVSSAHLHARARDLVAEGRRTGVDLQNLLDAVARAWRPTAGPQAGAPRTNDAPDVHDPSDHAERTTQTVDLAAATDGKPS